MKVLVDARELAGRPTGVGRYLFQLLRQWAATADAPAREIVLCAPDLPGDVRALGFRLVLTGGRGGTLWEQTRLPSIARAESPDVLFCPAYTCPMLTPVPAVLTIHDISFATHPEWFTLREGFRRRALTRWSARRAAALITVSKFSADELANAYGVPLSRIHVIHHGVKHLGSPGAASREPLVLFVGSVFNRRHVPELIAAVGRLRPHIPELRLAIVGENRTEPRQDLAAVVSAHGLEGMVELSDYVDEGALAELYGRARVLVFVSDYEGFGLTPLEALSAGVPPIVADTAVSRETCGEAAIYVAPGNVEALASAIRRAVTDDGARSRVLEAAPATLARYSWERAAAETLQVLERFRKR